jgi:choice-of-anchor A domain-containing protein
VFNGYGQVTLTASDAALNVFSMTVAQLASLNGFEINVPTGATTVINVQGAAAGINGFGYWGTGVNPEHTLFNFADATSLTAASNGIQGSVLAPLADATFSGGSVNGQFVARSANIWNGAEGHDHIFVGSLPPSGPPPGGSVREPGSMALLAVGLLPAVPLLRRRTF